MTQPITISSFPNAIAHIDGDAFFASVEQAVHPELKGQPVVTGKERGIISCASYEAKALGVKRGVSLRDAKKICPGLVVIPSDYETYSLFSKRMFDIFRRYSPIVEEYSIDEGFVDITGCRRVWHCSYKEIGSRIQADIYKELGITVSVGLSLSKGLAKLASSFRKPNGITAVPGLYLHMFLQRIPLNDVWGFGANTTRLLQKHGLRTAYDFVTRSEDWAGRLLGKTGREIWCELRGHPVNAVSTEEKSTYASISKGKTFSPSSCDSDIVYARLVRNVESAFIKLRRYGLRAGEISVVLRQQDFVQYGLRSRLNRPTDSTQEVLPFVKDLFGQLFDGSNMYRSTLLVLGKLSPAGSLQYDLFEDTLRIEQLARISEVVDEINGRLGKHKVCQGTGLYLPCKPKSDRDDQAWRKENLLKGETARKRLKIPRLDINV